MEKDKPVIYIHRISDVHVYQPACAYSSQGPKKEDLSPLELTRPCYFVCLKQPCYLHNLHLSLSHRVGVHHHHHHHQSYIQRPSMPTVEYWALVGSQANPPVIPLNFNMFWTFFFNLWSREQLRERQLKIYIFIYLQKQAIVIVASVTRVKKENEISSRKGFSSFKTWYQLACATGRLIQKVRMDPDL